MDFFFFSDPCYSNQDCKLKTVKTVCEKSLSTGKKKSVEPATSTCKEICPENNYCDGETGCMEVLCGSTAECLTISASYVCMPSGKSQDLTCQKPGDNQCDCSQDEYCTVEGRCKKPAFCSTNSDCESTPSTPVCKQYMPWGAKLCQSGKTCRRDCLPRQFCDARSRCKGKKDKKVLCSSTPDCSEQKPATVCKESSQSGERFCEKPGARTCDGSCLEGEFCSKRNVCKNVPCGTNSDCSKLSTKTVCKEEEVDGKRSCQEPSMCDCSHSEFCSWDGQCIKPELCSSTADCESVPYKPVCKESRPGGSKLCQSPLSCSQDCLPTQFCTVRGQCKEKHKEIGDSQVFSYYLSICPCSSCLQDYV
jgi:hypothetical protein